MVHTTIARKFRRFSNGLVSYTNFVWSLTGRDSRNSGRHRRTRNTSRPFFRHHYSFVRQRAKGGTDPRKRRRRDRRDIRAHLRSWGRRRWGEPCYYWGGHWYDRCLFTFFGGLGNTYRGAFRQLVSVRRRCVDFIHAQLLRHFGLHRRRLNFGRVTFTHFRTTFGRIGVTFRMSRERVQVAFARRITVIFFRYEASSR